jgi:NitT/TauT family transport system substrate-binding protein
VKGHSLALVRLAALLTIVLLLISSAPAGPARDKVSFRLAWVWKGEYAFIVVAQRKGFYEKHGMDVDLALGRGTVPAIQALVSRANTFAYGGGSGFLLTRSKGAPVRMVATVLQRGPLVIMSYPDKPVRKPKDLEGKSIILTPGESFTTLWPAFVAAFGIDRSKVQELSIGVEARTQAFLQRRADAAPEFITNAVYPIEETAKVEIVKLYLADVGFDMVNAGILTHEDTIRTNPDLVKRFVAANMEALEYTAKNIDEATDLILPELAGQSRTAVRKQIQAVVDLSHTKRTQGKPLGWSHLEDWKDSLRLMVKGGTITAAEAAGVYYYFTNEFITGK